MFTSIDPKSGRPTYDETKVPHIGKRAEFCPSLWGGKDWPLAAYNPKTGLLYIPAHENLCGNLIGRAETYRPGQMYLTARIADIGLTLYEGADHIGEVQAWNVNSRKKVWQHDFKYQNWGPLLTTGGGLVFGGARTTATSGPTMPPPEKSCGSSAPIRVLPRYPAHSRLMAGSISRCNPDGESMRK